MLRTKDLAGLVGAAIMVVAFILLLVKRKDLGKESGFFIAAMGTIALIESYASANRAADPEFNSVPVYTVGVSLVLFLLFMLYFHAVLKQKKLKNINAALISALIIHHAASTLFIERFIWEPPFWSYLFNVILLSASLYLVLSEIFRSERVLTLEHYFPFYACITVMITYIGVIPLLVVRYFTEKFHPDIFHTILLVVNILGYTVLFMGIYKAKTDCL